MFIFLSQSLCLKILPYFVFKILKFSWKGMELYYLILVKPSLKLTVFLTHFFDIKIFCFFCFMQKQRKRLLIKKLFLEPVLILFIFKIFRLWKICFSCQNLSTFETFRFLARFHVLICPVLGFQFSTWNSSTCSELHKTRKHELDHKFLSRWLVFASRVFHIPFYFPVLLCLTQENNNKIPDS